MKRRSLRRTLLSAWLVPAFAAIALSGVTFLGLGWIEYRGALARVVQDLAAKSQTASRRLSAELLLGSEGQPAAVEKRLAEDLNLHSVRLIKGELVCANASTASDGCYTQEGGVVRFQEKVSYVPEAWTVSVEASAPTFISMLRFELLIWSTLPVLFFLILGAWAQRKILRRGLVEPVEVLASTAALHSPIPKHWPEELAKVSEQLQDAFRQRELALVGQFSSGIIHDLRTLLHSVWSAAQLASESEPGSARRTQRLEAFLKAANVNLPKMQTLIQSTLDGVREIRVNLHDLDLNETIQQATRSVRELATRSNVRIDLDLPESCREVRHDRAQLERALTNLLRNAIEAASVKQGRVRLSIRKLETGRAQITVEDSGGGLGDNPIAVLKTVRSTKPHGTGLGLVISRKIIEAHRGSLIAKNSPDMGGARFEIELPSGGIA